VLDPWTERLAEWGELPFALPIGASEQTATVRSARAAP
jgi:hypothetical protein